MTSLLNMTISVTHEKYTTLVPGCIGRIYSTGVLVPGKTLPSM